MIYMPMTGWGVAGGAVADDEEHVQVTLAELGAREYVCVPRDALPAPFVVQTAVLTQYYARDLGIPTPPRHFFTEWTPELGTPWLARIDPALQPSYFFRSRRLHGFAQDGRIWLDIAESGAQLVDTVAHEVAHVAGYDERQARVYAAAARAQLRGG